MKIEMCEITEVNLEINEITIQIPNDLNIGVGKVFLVTDKNAISGSED